MSSNLTRGPIVRALLTRLLDTPDLEQRVQALTPVSFSALIREVGIEDAGELVAMARSEQLIAAFDEDLFTNSAPGERETLDPGRFALWLMAIMEQGEAAAAARFAELSEDFVVHALSSIVLVLDQDALRERMSEERAASDAVDKALESSLCEEIDGYLLVSREYDAWQAALDLVLALDRDHRTFLVRVLDRCAALTRALVDDLDELATQLSASESLAEDVEAEREQRRAALGYVEPRAAQSFLTLARQPLRGATHEIARDPITRSYFRDLDRDAVAPASRPRIGLALPVRSHAGAAELPLVDTLKVLAACDPVAFDERMEELAYLANVLLAAGEAGGERMRPAEAVAAALGSVARGAQLELGTRTATSNDLADILARCSADRLFRRARSSAAVDAGSVRGLK